MKNMVTTYGRDPYALQQYLNVICCEGCDMFRQLDFKSGSVEKFSDTARVHSLRIQYFSLSFLPMISTTHK